MKTQIAKPNRRGIATVECALCLPLILLVTFGVIETCSALFVKEALTIAAYEGARVGIQSGATEYDAETRIREVLEERRIEYTEDSICFSEPSFTDAGALDPVTTTISVCCNGNTVAGWFLKDRVISATATLRKEYKNQ